MATSDQTVTVKFLSDTKGYVKGVGQATKAQDNLNKELKETNTEQKLVVNQTGQLTDSLGDLGQAATQTGEGLLDAATGTSGLGAAFTAIGTRVTTAVSALSNFSKALIATGIGAALVAITLLFVFWEDIAEAIGLSTFNLEKFNTESERQNTILQKRITILKNLGAEQELIDNAELNRLIAIRDQAAERLKQREKEVESRQALNRALGGQIISTERMNELLEGQFDTVEELTVEFDLADSAVTNYLNTIDTGGEEGEGVDGANVKWQRQVDILAQLKATADDATVSIEDLIRALSEEVFAETEEDRRRKDAFNDLTRRIAEAQKKEDEQRKINNNNLREDARDELARAQELANAKANFATALSSLASELAGENAEAAFAIDIASAIANTAIGITNAFATLIFPANAIQAGATAAIGIAQIASITKAYNSAGVSGGAGGLPSAGASAAPTQDPALAVSRADRAAQLERDNLNNTPRGQIVLITEDLDRVQQSVAVTNERSSI